MHNKSIQLTAIAAADCGVVPQKMEIIIEPFLIEDYGFVVELWQKTEGIVLSETDDIASMRLFLDRNPGLSLIAKYRDLVIGAILCSHDGRRGYLHHLAVKEEFRNQNIGSNLVQNCLRNLEKEGIRKCNIFILDENDKGMKFWEKNSFNVLPHFGWMQTST